MSFRLLPMVWRTGFEGNPKFVLLRLADYGDDDGSRIFPAVARVARECGISERTVQTCLRTLETAKVLVLVREADPVRKLPREYRIDVAVLRELGSVTTDDGCDICTPANAAPAQHLHPVQKSTGTGANSAPNPTIEPTKTPAAVPPEPAKPKSEHIVIGQRIDVLTGWDQDQYWFGSYGLIIPWLRAGWDADLDIYPTVERLMANRRRKGQGPPKGLEYFADAIANAYASRTKPAPEGKPNDRPPQQNRPSPRPTRPSTGDIFSRVLHAVDPEFQCH